MEWAMDVLAMLSEHQWLWLALCAVLGGMAASFAGVAASRMPALLVAENENDGGASACSLWSRSKCEGCGKALGFVDLVPVLGYLVRRGRCHACGHVVPWSYPVLEACSAVLFMVIGYRHGASGTAFFAMLISAFLMAAAWLDWRCCWVPDRFVFPVVCLGLLASPFEVSAEARIWGMCVPSAMMLTVMWLASLYMRRNAISMGDVYIIAAGGAVLGIGMWFPLLMSCSFMFIAYGLPLRWFRRWMKAYARQDGVPTLMSPDKNEDPMGPALAAGIILCMLNPQWSMPWF